MNLPKEKKLTLEEVKERSKAMFDRFEGTRGLKAKVDWRLQHFYQDPKADPLMPGSTRDADGRARGRWQDAACQTTWVNDVFWKWQARQIENPWKVEVKPMVETIPNKKDANEAEAYLMQMIEFIRERTGIDVQANLAFAKGIKAAGVLHWRVDGSIYEDIPDYEEWDEPPTEMEVDDPDAQEVVDTYSDRAIANRVKQRKAKKKLPRHTADDYAEGVEVDDVEEYKDEKGEPATRVVGRKQRAKEKKFRETEESLRDRIARYKAECGPPVFFETLPLEQCAWVQDKNTASQTSEFGVKRVIASLGDWKAIKHKNMANLERLAPVQDTQGSKDQWMPSASDFKKTVTITEHWTRRYWYEWCNDGEQDYFDSGEHIYRMPPFALDPGRFTDVADPMWAYQPVFHSMLEEKPNYDRLNSLVNAAVEGAAFPMWVYQPTTGGVPQLLTDGTDEADGLDSGSAKDVPFGKKLEAVGGLGVNQQIIQMLQESKLAMEKAEPSTGFATFGATTQPTSAWQEQAQENMEPKAHIKGTARTLQVMINNIIQCFASDDGPGEVFGYAKGDDGKLDRTKVLSRKPEQWKSIIADVKIMDVGNVERGALEELGMVKLEKGLITDIEFIGDYEGKPNPEAVYVERQAWAGYKTEIMPGQIRSAEAKAFGIPIALAPGALPMVGGQAVSDEEAIASQGGQAMVPGAQMLQNAAPSTQASTMPQAQPAMATPGVF